MPNFRQLLIKQFYKISKKSYKDFQLNVKIYQISPASQWNSTTVILLANAIGIITLWSHFRSCPLKPYFENGQISCTIQFQNFISGLELTILISLKIAEYHATFKIATPDTLFFFFFKIWMIKVKRTKEAWKIEFLKVKVVYLGIQCEFLGKNA